MEERKAMTVQQLCGEYLAATEKGLVLGKRGQAKKETTLATDRGRIARHILPLLGKRKVRDLTAPDIVRFMRDVASGKTAADVKTKKQGRAIVEGGAGTATRTVGLLGGILSFAVSEGIIPANPARGIRRPADSKREVRLSAIQYRALGMGLTAADAKRDAWQITAAIRLLALTGCRRGEIEKLRWDDVDIPGQSLRLSDTKTGKSVRPLGIAAITVLRELPRSGPFVLPGIVGREKSGDLEGHFTGLPKAWTRVLALAADAVERARVDGTLADNEARQASLSGLTPHGLRHGFASVAHDLGYTELTIAALLGHSSGSVTGRYIHHVDSALVAAADRVSDWIANEINGAEPLCAPNAIHGEVKGA
jgi:integrase